MKSLIVSSNFLCKCLPGPNLGNRIGVLGHASCPKKPRKYTRILASSFGSSVFSRKNAARLKRRASCMVVQSGSKQLFDIAEENNSEASEGEDGPIELPQEWNPFEVPEASPLQTAASVLLSGAIAVLLYRSLKRRTQRAKEMKFRSSGVKSVREEAKSEAMKALKELKTAKGVTSATPPSAIQALLGGIIAGVIALVLYKFTTIVEAGLDRQTVSTNYSIRQITITVRTIINGLCYLATFVYAVNSIGLTLYSGQLAFNFWMNMFTGGKDSKPNETESRMDVEVKDDNQ